MAKKDCSRLRGKKKLQCLSDNGLGVFQHSKARKRLGFAGERLVYRHTYDEKRFPDWSKDAQAWIDIEKEDGRKAAVDHRGRYHHLYIEKRKKGKR